MRGLVVQQRRLAGIPGRSRDPVFSITPCAIAIPRRHREFSISRISAIIPISIQWQAIRLAEATGECHACLPRNSVAGTRRSASVIGLRYMRNAFIRRCADGSTLANQLTDASNCVVDSAPDDEILDRPCKFNPSQRADCHWLIPGQARRRLRTSYQRLVKNKLENTKILWCSGAPISCGTGKSKSTSQVSR